MTVAAQYNPAVSFIQKHDHSKKNAAGSPGTRAASLPHLRRRRRHMDISWHKSIDGNLLDAGARSHLSMRNYCRAHVRIRDPGDDVRPEPGLARGTVKVWAFRGSAGRPSCALGRIAMIASAPFDDGWHNAYGLDVRVSALRTWCLFFGLSPSDRNAAFYIGSVEPGARQVKR